MKNIILWATILLISVSCSNNNKSESEQSSLSESIIQLSDEQLKNTSVKIGIPETKTILTTLKVNGTIDVPPQNMISVSIPLGGYLKYTKLLPGMHVYKGEVIALIEDQQYIQLQQEYLIAVENLKLKELDFLRQKELNVEKASSDKVFQQSQADYMNQKIGVKSLEEKLKLIGINPEKLNENTISRSISVLSPIDGYVTSVNVNIGKYVTPSDVLFELVNPEDIHLNLTVFEKDLDQLFIGQKVMAYTNHLPNKKYECDIILIGKNLSNERSVEVHCHFKSYDKNLIPGMFINADIELKTHQALVLPNEAIVRFENKSYAFLAVNKNMFEMIEVSIGNSYEGYTEIMIEDKYSSKNFVIKDAYTLLMAIKNKEE
ncbi:MAG: efflux RND transporter periplasmic adaptor subunit [Bacteroidetes bacterium]|nr:efflux RND transporter periplasmic adaptor subunit [Bacteroidota bacterium]MBV6461493.1 Cobalt-zinc-cadmium resistance protein CzcB [Flavobacteriales bacterium]WKZ76511.1 MAG: efflux RND transporter periplasmic adaptor subunit [Vicingaceae bacterium]MCL4815662.1 efflux RND transporter periplasmic adaptor subunit [Flavobacteriales bacterium]NOG94195.1 efflux RND transporter periplasmic adaptor subunit [Bacteroidota bacterium]